MVVLLLPVGVATAAMAPVGRTLILNGQVASRDVRLINGRPYVPLADVARALKQTVVTRAGGYEITAAGAANPTQGLTGNAGETPSDVRWRFQVLSVSELDSYTPSNKVTPDYAAYRNVAEYTQGEFRPKEGNKLVAIRCRVKNGLRNESQSLWWARSDSRTAITDRQGESYPPIAIDAPAETPFQSKPLLPGAGIDLTLLFSVPDAAEPKDLVFTLRTISDRGMDVRVSLGG
jgi:hypothetical protein